MIESIKNQTRCSGVTKWIIKNSRSNDNKSPEEVIEDLEMAIIRAEKEGNYRCCIEPACTMCYLGHWKFEKGTCSCDDAIAEGRDEDVCPECVKGIEKGLCKSTIDEEKCDIGSGANFKLIDS